MWLAANRAAIICFWPRLYNITNGENRTLRSIVQGSDELSIDCRIRSVPYPMLDAESPAVWSASAKIRQEPPLTHYGVSKLNFDFTPIRLARRTSWATSPSSRWTKALSAPPLAARITEIYRVNHGPYFSSNASASPAFRHLRYRSIAPDGVHLERIITRATRAPVISALTSPAIARGNATPLRYRLAYTARQPDKNATLGVRRGANHLRRQLAPREAQAGINLYAAARYRMGHHIHISLMS